MTELFSKCVRWTGFWLSLCWWTVDFPFVFVVDVDGVDGSPVVGAWRDPNFYYYESVYRQVFSLTFSFLWGLIDSAYLCLSRCRLCRQTFSLQQTTILIDDRINLCVHWTGFIWSLTATRWLCRCRWCRWGWVVGVDGSLVEDRWLLLSVPLEAGVR